MGYTVEFSGDAIKTLRRLPRNIADRLQRKILQLADRPADLSANVKRLRNSEYRRLRVGNFRVIYMLHDEDAKLFILKIGPRGDVYVQDSED